jgi:DNA-binding transcriptional LysR family regulator
MLFSMSFMNTNSPLDLRKLRHALVLAESGTFARASRELHITQSALTRSIQALEYDLGVELFERSPAGVKPTIGGSELLSRAQLLLLQANGLRHDAELLRDGNAGTLAFGMGPMLAPWLTPVLAALMADAPRLRLRVEIEPIARLQEMLLAEKLEFFVSDISRLAKDAGTIQECIGSMQIGYFARGGHPLAARGSVAKQVLQQFPLLIGGLQEWRGAPGDAGEWIGQISCENVGMLKDIALNSNAILLAATAAMTEELRTGQLVEIRVQNQQPFTSDVRVVAHAHRSRSPLAQRVITLLTHKVRQQA